MGPLARRGDLRRNEVICHHFLREIERFHVEIVRVLIEPFEGVGIVLSPFTCPRK